MATLIWLTYKGGAYLDAKFGTDMIFTAVLFILAIIFSFMNLFDKLMYIEKRKKKDKK